MKYSWLIILFALHYNKLCAQSNIPLNTPFYWLKEARSKAASKDSSGTFFSLKKAVKAGLFDPQVITNSKTYNALLSGSQKKEIEDGIWANRIKLERPSAIKIVTTDINNFWNCFPSINDSNAVTIFLKNYIGKGSAGLQTFFQIRMNSNADNLIKNIRLKQSYYHSIKDVSKQFRKMRPQFEKAANKLESLYPASIFPPIYFLIGHLNNVGTADGYSGLLIGTEHLGKHPGADTSQLTMNDKLVLFDTSLAVRLIVHEYVHFQQKNKAEQSLLDYSIMEGVADFITYLITGQYTAPEVYQYGFANEGAIWKDFSTEMNTENTDKWLFNTYNPETGYPGNLGYFIGFRICESYYRQSQNQQHAIKELLEIRDFNQILSQSGYNGK